MAKAPNIALVHDYIKEFGGAERVLEVLHEIYPDAPIYTAFCDRKSPAFRHFADARIVSSWFGLVPFAPKLASPLRFLTPFIWGSFDFSGYDVVISSASWYSTKGFGTLRQAQDKQAQKKPIEICYCHTPPRWLYGYTTSVHFQKYAPVRLYATVVGYFLRKYDYAKAQKVNIFLANSKEVQERIKKFYGRDAEVVYPPVFLKETKETRGTKETKGNYYFIVSRIVGGKGIELAIQAAVQKGFVLKIAGVATGYFDIARLQKQSQSHVAFLGQVSDEELVQLYKGAKAFLALSKDEDFGITPVEAMLYGTPVIAYNGGGYKETVIDGKTGILFDDYSVAGLIGALQRFERMHIQPGDCKKQAEKFSKKHFVEKIKKIVAGALSNTTS